GGALFKEGGNQDHPMAPGQLAQGGGAGSGNGFGQLEISVVFALTKVLGAEQLLRAEDARALPRRARDQPGGAGEILRRIGRRAGLNQTEQNPPRRALPGMLRLQILAWPRAGTAV